MRGLKSQNRRVWAGIGAAVSLTLATGGSAVAATKVPAPAATWQAKTTTPKLAATTDKNVDAGSKLTVTPGTLIAATFSSKTYLAAGRKVDLQSSTDGKTWKTVETKTMDAKGGVTFATIPNNGVTYKAVAQAYTYKASGKSQTAPAATSVTGSIADNWKFEFIDDFGNSKTTKNQWVASTGVFGAKRGRLCSADYATNGSVSDGTLKMKVSKAPAKVAKEAEQNALAKQAETGIDEVGCPFGVFYNASWKTYYVMQYGIVAARIKMSKDQGSHGSFWLYTNTDYEIDVVESYGYGAGLTTGTWIQGKQNFGTMSKGERTIPDQTKDPKWWDEYHIYSVEWNPKGYTFRIDGVVTNTITAKVPKQDYRIFLTNYSSDWEVNRMTAPKDWNGKGAKPAQLPTTMTVDWVQAWTK